MQKFTQVPVMATAPVAPSEVKRVEEVRIDWDAPNRKSGNDDPDYNDGEIPPHMKT